MTIFLFVVIGGLVIWFVGGMVAAARADRGPTNDAELNGLFRAAGEMDREVDAYRNRVHDALDKYAAGKRSGREG